MKTRAFLATAALSAVFLATSCAGRNEQWVELKGKKYTVEVADTPDLRASGLMFRDEMATDAGMLFIHPQNEMQAYWMKNTRIPLDILYFDPELKLVSVSADTPPCSGGNSCPPYPSTGPAQYILELNAGEAAKLGVKSGDALKVSDKISLKPKE